MPQLPLAYEAARGRMPKSFSITCILVASTSLCFGASTADAGDAACVWKGIPENYRTAFLAAYPEEGRSALVRLDPPSEVFGAAMAGCGVRNHDQVAAAIKALMAYSFDEGAARLLHDKFGIARSQIDAAWEALPADRRGAFSRSVLQNEENGLPASSADPGLYETAISIVQEVSRALKINDPVASDQIGVYLTWKVARPLYEAKF